MVKTDIAENSSSKKSSKKPLSSVTKKSKKEKTSSVTSSASVKVNILYKSKLIIYNNNMMVFIGKQFRGYIRGKSIF